MVFSGPPQLGFASGDRWSRCRPGRGFSLVEVLAVVAIVAILAGVALGVGPWASEAARSAQARGELQAIAAALESYRLAEGGYPVTASPAKLLQHLIGRRGPGDLVTSRRPYLETAALTLTGDPLLDEGALLLDPWGHPYHYVFGSVSPWTNSAPVLYSAGPDGLASGVVMPGGFPDSSSATEADNIHAYP